MKRERLKRLALIALGGLLAGGCAAQRAHHPVTVTPAGTVIVPERPPPSTREAPGAEPQTAYSWMPGYWAFSDYRWVWIPSHWQAPERTGTLWVPGHWDHTPEGWVWTPGKWS